MNNYIASIGIALFFSASAMFHFQLFNFSNFLKKNCPQIWNSHIEKHGKVGFWRRYHTLKMLSLEYETENKELNARLKSLALMYRLQFLGIFFMGMLPFIVDFIATLNT
ncbi:MAG: hypothetical protein COC19_03720 [SAR86 cluster bacterium]|uniref:Uncharacterized protein n=1 Tax=SAR86 cluster bacterium TaxID=2030880 RepID=A0A2A4MPF5_9GAMM|nr:MAG: hypothetical protein COC19_03720 [SAR86 cluster bacterium]